MPWSPTRYLTNAGKPGWQHTIAPLDDVTTVLEPERWSAWDPTEMFNTILAHGHGPTGCGPYRDIRR